MAENQLLPFAHADDANLTPYSDWSSAAYENLRKRGFQSGVAKSDEVNRAVAQGAIAGYAIGELIKDYAGKDATLKHAAFYSGFKDAIEAFFKRQVIGFIYPVGSVYISTVSTNPGTLFGIGTWQRIGEGRGLIDSGTEIRAGTTGGSSSCSLTATELPSHSHSGTTGKSGAHTPTAKSADSGAHSHSLTVANGGDHVHSGTTATAGDHGHGGSASSAGAHSHTGTTDGGGGHSHSASSVGAGNHAHDKGTMDITGQVSVARRGDGADDWADGCFSYDSHWNAAIKAGARDTWGSRIGFRASRNWTGVTSYSGDHSHGITVNGVGDHSHGFTTNSGGGHTHSITANSAGSHSHSVTIDNGGSHAHTATAANSVAHSHTITCDPVSAHTHDFTTGNTGGGQAFSIRNPYLAVYIWKRVA